MTSHELDLLTTIIDCCLISAWVGALISYVLTTLDKQRPEIMLAFWVMGMVLAYPVLWIMFMNCGMALWSLYDIYQKEDKNE